jgi:methylated-DNA-protein-cysteine methyltransferase related protein
VHPRIGGIWENQDTMIVRAKIWAAVKRIPRGRVATYGQIADVAGCSGHARQVGYALSALPSDSDVPWHRVINSFGEISARSGDDSHELQRRLLESEGIVFDENDRIDLRKYKWDSPPPARETPGRRR